MTAAFGQKAQKIEGYTVTMERLCKDIREVSTPDFEAGMNQAKVQACKDKLTEIETKLDQFHTLLAEACATSNDPDVVARSGGGGGKS